MFKSKLYQVLYFSALTISISCSIGNQKSVNAFENSKIYPSISCISDTNQSYALYLPPKYKSGKPCPVLILFDSHGDGLLPVNLFSDEASKNDFIIAGSNNSKNGMPIEQTTAIYQAILNDIKERFSIETKAVYLCGFSGGSRVAGAAAITQGGVAGVVGCGAGLPNLKQQPVNPFSYLGVVGNQDFNLTEMLQLDQSLDKAGYNHHLLKFPGTHQWPPKEIIPDIFTWLTFDAMRQKAIPESRAEINSFIEKNDKTANDYASENNHLKQLETYSMMLHFLQGLTDVAPLQSEIMRLENEPDIIAGQEKQKQLLVMEQDLQREYSPQIEAKDVAWWTKEADKLHSLTVHSSNTEISAVYKRLLGYLSLNCYMYCTNALKQNDLTSASKYTRIYCLVDHTNSEAPYLSAKVAALNHDPDAVFKFLEQAYSLGFKDTNRLNADVDLKVYQQDERFKKLVTGK